MNTLGYIASLSFIIQAFLSFRTFKESRIRSALVMGLVFICISMLVVPWNHLSGHIDISLSIDMLQVGIVVACMFSVGLLATYIMLKNLFIQAVLTCANLVVCVVLLQQGSEPGKISGVLGVYLLLQGIAGVILLAVRTKDLRGQWLPLLRIVIMTLIFLLVIIWYIQLLLTKFLSVSIANILLALLGVLGIFLVLISAFRRRSPKS